MVCRNSKNEVISLTITLQVKLCPSKEQVLLIENTMKEYISLVNDIIDYAIAIDEMPKLSSANLNAPLPAALKDQCRIDARSIYKKFIKSNSTCPVLKKSVAIWNNQNYTIGSDYIAMPFRINGKTKKTSVPAIIPQEIHNKLKDGKLGTLRITKKNGKYIAQIAVTIAEPLNIGKNIMGVDLGLKCPAVITTSTNKCKFCGNGRQNKYVRRKYAKRRKKLGKAKKLRAIKKLGNKEQRWMKDQDHKISRQIINYAIANDVKLIKLESLTGIRASARTSRKNEKNLHTWSFYRLATFIEYKAKLAGIDVQYVNPAYTSQTCPICGKRHKAKGRKYVCKDCGYICHRDRVGSINILRA